MTRLTDAEIKRLLEWSNAAPMRHADSIAHLVAEVRQLRAIASSVESLGRDLCAPASNEGAPGLTIIRNVLADRARDLKWARAESERLRGVLEGIAEADCEYSDSCPSNTRHYRCVPCKARVALTWRTP